MPRGGRGIGATDNILTLGCCATKMSDVNGLVVSPEVSVKRGGGRGGGLDMRSPERRSAYTKSGKKDLSTGLFGKNGSFKTKFTTSKALGKTFGMRKTSYFSHSFHISSVGPKRRLVQILYGY